MGVLTAPIFHTKCKSPPNTKDESKMKSGIKANGSFERPMTQTKYRGDNNSEYQIYLTFANNGKGGDITNNGLPLKTYEEWINS